jgi:aerobic carbon-monoxide dehydrogenase medium subunit
MIPGRFEYHVPNALPDAIALLQRYGVEAKLLAGGQSLIPLMRFRLAEPAHLVDLSRLAGLDYVEERDGFLRIGALTKEADLEAAPIVAERYPILADTAAAIADPLVRNLATVGGNLAHADPANDHPATMLALGAEIGVEGPNGARTIPIDDFFKDIFTTALEPNEVLVEIKVPVPRPSSGGAYLKLERKVGDYAIVGVAAYVELDSSGAFSGVRIGMTNVGSTPLRARQAEASLLGQQPSDSLLRAAGELAAGEADPTSDDRGPADYKRAMIRTLTVRALRKAIERAEG